MNKSSFLKKSTNPFLNKNKRIRTIYIYDFDVIESSNYISISISTESWGAYSESYNVYFNFDKYTGEVLTLNSLFDKNNLQKLENIDRNIDIILNKRSYNHEKRKLQNEETFILKKENNTLKGIFKTPNTREMNVFLKAI